jgi:hypothetical protein
MELSFSPMWRTIHRAAPAFRLAFVESQRGRDESRPGAMNRAPHLLDRKRTKDGLGIARVAIAPTTQMSFGRLLIDFPVLLPHPRA